MNIEYLYDLSIDRIINNRMVPRCTISHEDEDMIYMVIGCIYYEFAKYEESL